MAFFNHPSFTLSGADRAQHILGAKVTRDMLGVLGLKLELGRNFTPEEDRANGPHAALLGYGLWQRLFHGGRGVLGRRIVLDGESYPIVGVLPASASFPDRVEVWVPLAPDAAPRGHGWYLGGTAVSSVGHGEAGRSRSDARASRADRGRA